MNPWYGYPGYYPQMHGAFARQQPQNDLSVPSPEGELLPIEQSYIENILRLNLGKEASVYMTFGSGQNGNSQVFTGVLDEAGRDHIILRNENTGTNYLLLMIYLDYITFEDEIEYTYPFGNPGTDLSEYSPR